MAAAEGRKKLADVTPASYQGWSDLARRHGTDPTALAEVIGLWFATLTGSLESLPPGLRRNIIDAQELTAARKRRPQA